MNDNLYGLIRNLRTADVKLSTLYTDKEQLPVSPEAVAQRMLSDDNISYLTKMVIDRADPLRNGSAVGQFAIVKDKVTQFMESWKSLGKFDRHYEVRNGKQVEVKSVNIIAHIDSLNLEFLNAFAEKILPASDITKVTSVVNPNGLFAQQERVIKTSAKPVPFYERALYRRLNDFNLDLGMDETESPFYKMDHNPKLSEAERKKTDKTVEQPSLIDREGMHTRMIPKHQKHKY